jgi:CCR4-NOT transcription complex subunit 7/8
MDTPLVRKKFFYIFINFIIIFFVFSHKKLFPNSYDIKMLLRQPAPLNAMLTGGLQEIANQLDVQRIGQRHQAGSDSLLTALTFFKLRELFFVDNWKEVFKF